MHMMKLGRCILWSLIVTFGFTAQANALTLNGTARDPNGRPIAEAFVTAHSPARRASETVLSNHAGHYAIVNLYPDEYQLRVRKDGFADGIVASVSVNALTQTIDLKLQKADPANPTRPGSAWLAAAPEGPMKTSFITSCTICHDPGSAMVQCPRDANGWTAVIQQMRGITSVYGGLFKLDDAAAAKWLADTHFGEHAA